MNSSAWLCTVSYLDLSLGWQLTLLHINDIHVRIDETNKYSTKCKVNTLSESNLIYNNCFVKEKDQEARSCYGGPARVQSKVTEYIRFFKEKNQEAGSCYGGLARVQSKVKEYIRFFKEKAHEAGSGYCGPARVQTKVKEYIRVFYGEKQEAGSCYGGLAGVKSKVKEYISFF